MYQCLKRGLSSLSYIHNVGKEPLQPQTIGNLIDKCVEKYGRDVAIISVHDGRRVSYDDILNESNLLAAGLQKMGLEKGDRVALWAPNIIEWVTTHYAIARSGLITVTLNPISHEKELMYCINKVGIKAIVCPDIYKNLNFYETLCRVVPGLDKCDQRKLKSEKVPSLESIVNISQKSLRGTHNYYDILNNTDNTGVDRIKKLQKEIPIDAIANIQFTSGTTGKPKATCLTHFQIVNNSYNIGKRLELDKGPNNYFVQVPLFHAFGTIVALLAAPHFGTTLTLGSPMYSPEANLLAIEQEKCTITCGTPTMFVDLVNLQIQKKRKLNLTTAISGGSPCSPQLFKDMKEVLNLKKLKSVYGLTESSAVCFQSLPDEDEDKAINTVGYIGEHLEAKVVDEQNNIVPRGTTGELCIRGYVVMAGYRGDEKKTKEVLGNDGWFKTGDQFVLREDGYGKIVGRIKDIIIRGGENIFAKEIEDVINNHPNIMEVQVIGIQHERLGEEVCGCIRLKPGCKVNYEDLRQHCEKHLSPYKIPSQWRVVERFSKTATGKVMKNELRKLIEIEGNRKNKI
ncbi:hypothetical protein FQA39_LY09122 [Lamprigera yunnana]|nr:hypothetical protein FQA39_LY09122 [Lamprigera yunnana]